MTAIGNELMRNIGQRFNGKPKVIPPPPRCPSHPCVQMRLVRCSEPIFANTAFGGRKKRKLRHRVKEADKRMIWRCGVESCPRVKSLEVT